MQERNKNDSHQKAEHYDYQPKLSYHKGLSATIQTYSNRCSLQQHQLTFNDKNNFTVDFVQ